MKKALSFLLAVVMIVGMIPMSMIPAFAAELPKVEIGTGNELIAFMNHVNNGDYDNSVNAILTADIDISMTEGLSDFDNVGYDDGFGYFSLTRGIGYDSKHPFRGTFDGNGHYINYFYDCDVEESLVHSLFAVNEGTIKNLTVGIPGDPDNTGCFFAVNVRECHTAGVCGINKGTIDSCANYLDVRGINVVGGIAAYNEGTVINCLNYNRVMGSSDNSFVGGMVGKQDGGRVYNCANYGEVLVDYYTGTSAGIVGCSNGGEVSSCFVGGTVSGHDPHTVVGKNNGATVTENYYEIKDGLPADNNAEGIEKALIDSGYAVSLLRDASKNIEDAKTWFIGADGYPAFVGSDVPSFLTETVYYTAENGIVTVGGTGNIPANAFENDNTIKEVILGEGIASVGANAFAGCENLHTITVKGQSITFENGALRDITGANAFTVEKTDGTKTDIVGNAITNTLSGNIEAVYIHRFDKEKDVVTAPACTAEGYTTHYCRDCDYSYTDTVTETTGHHYTQKRLADKVVASTCTEKGSITHYCDDCDYSYTEETAATGHYFDKNGKCTKCSQDYSTMVFGKNETVHFEGAEQVILFITENCDSNMGSFGHIIRGDNFEQSFELNGGTQKVFKVNGDWLYYSLVAYYNYTISIIPFYGDNKVTVEPFCAIDGYTGYTYCGQLIKDEIIPATGYHKFDRDGKCTECGTEFDLSDYKYISEADGYDKTFCFPGAEGVIIFLSHSFDAKPIVFYGDGKEGHAVSTPVSKGKDGVTSLSFIVVPYDTARIYLPMSNLVGRKSGNILCIIPMYGDNQIEIAPTCTKAGGIGYTWLGYTHQISYDIAATGHHYTQKRKANESTTPTCTEKGHITYYCDDCDYSYVEEKPALGHSIDENGICQNCKKPFSDIMKNEFSSGAGGFDKTLHFPGAESISINFTGIRGFSGSSYIYIYDKDGNKAGLISIDSSTGLPHAVLYENGQKVYTETGAKGKLNNTTGIYTCTMESGVITVTGDTVHIVSTNSIKGFTIKSITPSYPAEETPTTPEQNQPENGSPSDTASVLSDGNLWIILVVAVLAIGGIAALVIVKKKKKPVTANGAVDSDDE